jgi:hypothetical protein
VIAVSEPPITIAAPTVIAVSEPPITIAAPTVIAVSEPPITIAAPTAVIVTEPPTMIAAPVIETVITPSTTAAVIPEPATTDPVEVVASSTPDSASLLAEVELISPIEGQMTPYGNAKTFRWAIPVALLATSASFDLVVTDLQASTTVYQDNTLTTGHCDPFGICSMVVPASSVLTESSDHEWRLSASLDQTTSESMTGSFKVDINPEPEVTMLETNEQFTVLKQKFDDVVSVYPDAWYTTRDLQKQATTDNGYHQYPALYGLAMMYEMTGDVSYLQLGLDMSLKYANDGVDMDGDGFLDWEWGYASNYDRLNHDHYEWRTAMGISFIAAQLAKDPSASVQPSNALATLTQYLDVHFWDKWTPQNAPQGRSNNATKGADFVARLISAAINLHMITGDDKYMQYINTKGQQVVTGMEGTYRADTASYDLRWRIDGSGGPNYADFPSQDVSHAQDMIICLTYAFRSGYDFNGALTNSIMTGLTNTATDVVYTGDDLTYRSDGGGPPFDYSPPALYVTHQVAGWTALSTFNDALLEKFVARSLTDESINNSRGRTVSFENRLMLFANLARASM